MKFKIGDVITSDMAGHTHYKKIWIVLKIDIYDGGKTRYWVGKPGSVESDWYHTLGDDTRLYYNGLQLAIRKAKALE